MNANDRKDILLRAAYDILTKCNRSHYVLNAVEITAFYDGTNCDGACLREEIAEILGIDETEDPICGSGDED